MPALLKTAKGAVRSTLGNRRKTWGQARIPDNTREFEPVPVFLPWSAKLFSTEQVMPGFAPAWGEAQMA
jgi:hypothetical protein